MSGRSFFQLNPYITYLQLLIISYKRKLASLVSDLDELIFGSFHLNEARAPAADSPIDFLYQRIFHQDLYLILFI